MYRQKTIINRQRRNVSQIANVQRKVRQTDRSPCKHTVKYRQSSPCKHGKIIDNISTKFARRRSRQSSPCKCHANIDKVQRNYRLNSPCKSNAIDNIQLLRNRNGLLRNRDVLLRNHNALLRNRKTRNFFVVKLHLFNIQGLRTPKNLKG